MFALQRQKTKYMPSYRLEPKIPYNKEQCEKLLKAIVDSTMESFVYESDAAESLSRTLSNDILNQVKDLKFDRYKLVCVVTIGERYMQSFCDVFRCLWDLQKDGFAFYVYDTQNVFAIAALYAIYCD